MAKLNATRLAVSHQLAALLSNASVAYWLFICKRKKNPIHLQRRLLNVVTLKIIVVTSI